VKRVSARDNTYGCNVALQAIRWPCKLWGAPTVSKHAGMHALSLTLPKLHLASLKSHKCQIVLVESLLSLIALHISLTEHEGGIYTPIVVI